MDDIRLAGHMPFTVPLGTELVIAFEDEDICAHVVASVQATCAQSGFASVADLYELINREPQRLDHTLGWESFDGYRIQHLPDERCSLTLPETTLHPHYWRT